MPRTSNKREKLLEAATELIHQQGFKHTTLADIAEKSEVPLGNVYYYFKTKDDIASAVIDERNSELAKMAEKWEQLYSDPRQRLIAFLDLLDSSCDEVAHKGCPIGSLCQELNKDAGSLSEFASSTLKFLINWTEKQFTQIGISDSHGAAIEHISSLQGLALLANSLNDPALMSDQINRLRKKLNEL